MHQQYLAIVATMLMTSCRMVQIGFIHDLLSILSGYWNSVHNTLISDVASLKTLQVSYIFYVINVPDGTKPLPDLKLTYDHSENTYIISVLTNDLEFNP